MQTYQGRYQDICLWMRSHRLQLNTSKTEFIWCCPPRRHQHIPDDDFLVGADRVKPVLYARNLGVFVDSQASHASHITHVAASCFSAMRHIRTIRKSLPPSALEMLVTSLVHSRLDYCNVVFAGLPSCDMHRLQFVLNSPIRLVTGARKLTTWRCCYVITIGCRWLSASSTNFVLSSFGA